jgi:hypothetical protein
MAKQTINDGESGSVVRGKINANFTEMYDRQFSYKLVFYTILQSTPIYHTYAEALTAITDAAINGVEYSVNNGTTWTAYSSPVTVTANSESLWRVASFNSGYSIGCLTLVIS